jgi:hypothetical protein
MMQALGGLLETRREQTRSRPDRTCCATVARYLKAERRKIKPQ